MPNLQAFVAGSAAAAPSFLLCLLLVKSFAWHARFTADQVGLGPQNRHGTAVPRVGGIAVVLGTLVGVLVLPGAAMDFGFGLLAVCVPALASGLWEDMTRRVDSLWRLAATAASGALAWQQLGAGLVPLGLPGLPALDALMAMSAVAAVLTVLMVAGLANAINIIDGVNGLAAGCLVIMSTAIALAAWQVGDLPLAGAAAALAGAAAGFLLWNCPHGRIFLGDGGAYFGGSAVAVLALLLVLRNPTVSPLFVFALTAYPVTETAYSAWRRMARKGRSPFDADRLHLHTLIQARLLRCADTWDAQRRRSQRNARTAPYLWLICLCGAGPCAWAGTSTAALGLAIAASLAGYALLYRSVVRGRAPAWLRQERAPRRRPLGEPSILG